MSKIGQCSVCGETRKLEKSRDRCHPCGYRARKEAVDPSAPEPPERKCVWCGEWKPIAEFHKLGSGKRRSRCSTCRAATRGSRQGRPNGRPSSMTPEERRRYKLKAYGITEEQFEAMMALQGGRCAICQALPGARRLSIDHCHQSGRVRALLCDPCNLALGGYEALLGKAEAYLARYGNGNPLLGYNDSRA